MHIANFSVFIFSFHILGQGLNISLDWMHLLEGMGLENRYGKFEEGMSLNILITAPTGV
jgi:hypothetical protein